MFKPSPVFLQTNPHTGASEWYFSEQERTFGPYSSRSVASQFHQEYLRYRAISRKRSWGQGDLSLVPLDGPELFDPSRQKKGREALAF